MQCPNYDDIGTVAFDSICRTKPGFTIYSKATLMTLMVFFCVCVFFSIIMRPFCCIY